jgi:hypothetical protein
MLKPTLLAIARTYGYVVDKKTYIHINLWTKHRYQNKKLLLASIEYLMNIQSKKTLGSLN